MNESSDELVIDPQLLADIQRQCQQRVALQQLPDASGSPQSVFGVAEVSPSISEAERFAVAVEAMPGNIRRFFEREEPVPAWRRESDEDRAQRERLTDLGGWCG